MGRTRAVSQSIAPAEAPAGALAVSAVDLVALGLMHIGAGVPALLPPGDAAQMRQPVPDAEPFGLADAWGLGLAVQRAGGTDWLGHDGNADGTSCHLRIDAASGWVIAFTSNASTGFAMWHDLLDELAAAGVPIERPARPASREVPSVPPDGCAGTYANGDDEYLLSVDENGLLHLVIDGDATQLTCHDDLTFSVQDPMSGRQVPAGRLLPDSNSAAFDGIQVSGRFARRQHSSGRRVA